MKKCMWCGKEIDEDETFCVVCDKIIAEAEEENQNEM